MVFTFQPYAGVCVFVFWRRQQSAPIEPDREQAEGGQGNLLALRGISYDTMLLYLVTMIGRNLERSRSVVQADAAWCTVCALSAATSHALLVVGSF